MNEEAAVCYVIVTFPFCSLCLQAQQTLGWFCFDGPLFPSWVDHLSSLVGEPRVFCHPNGDRLSAAQKGIKLLFETGDLSEASPVTVTHAVSICLLSLQCYHNYAVIDGFHLHTSLTIKPASFICMHVIVCTIEPQVTPLQCYKCVEKCHIIFYLYSTYVSVCMTVLESMCVTSVCVFVPSSAQCVTDVGRTSDCCYL